MSKILTPGGVIRERKTLANAKIPTAAQALEICNCLGTALNLIYPGHLWEVGMIQSVVYIRNLRLSKTHGVKIPVENIDPEGKTLMRIGGEILERFSQKRGKVDHASIKQLKRDIKGDATDFN